MDTEIGIDEITSTGDIAQMEVAKMVAQILTEIYPVHLWRVGWQGGAIVVKHSATDNRYGYIMPPENFSYSDLRHAVMLAGGEILERAGLTRGAWDGEMGNKFEM